MNPNLSPAQFPRHRLNRMVDAPSLAVGSDRGLGRHQAPRPSRYSDVYARSLGFYDQADMRGEDW